MASSLLWQGSSGYPASVRMHYALRATEPVVRRDPEQAHSEMSRTELRQTPGTERPVITGFCSRNSHRGMGDIRCGSIRQSALRRSAFSCVADNRMSSGGYLRDLR